MFEVEANFFWIGLEYLLHDPLKLATVRTLKVSELDEQQPPLCGALPGASLKLEAEVDVAPDILLDQQLRAALKGVLSKLIAAKVGQASRRRTVLILDTLKEITRWITGADPIREELLKARRLLWIDLSEINPRELRAA